jgi:peptidoglycan/LPS O-acetylase OafA/YrhL
MKILDKEISYVLRAFAILGVVLAHVGYEIFENESLIFPLSAFGGMSGDLFFFLSGYGLAASYPKKNFYLDKFRKIVVPIWIFLAIFFVLDYFIHAIQYGASYVFRSFLMIFPTHDLWTDVNSPLWFITPIILYYLVFPHLYKRSAPLISFLALSAFGFLTYQYTENEIVADYFRLHYLALPLGVLAYHYLPERKNLFFTKDVSYKNFLAKIIGLALISLVIYFGINSQVGKAYEQIGSLFTMSLFISAVVLLNIRSRVLIAMGRYSFIIFLLHWPLMSRYDFLKPLLNIPDHQKAYQLTWLLLWIVSLFVASRAVFMMLAWYNKTYDKTELP